MTPAEEERMSLELSLALCFGGREDGYEAESDS